METKTISKTKWQVDPAHSEITFTVKHLMISNVKGSFGEFDAEIYADDAEFSNADVNVKIKAASITTGDAQRDTHLKSSDFFDVERFPEIEFKGTRFEKKSDNDYQLGGELTMHGITRPVLLDAEFGGIMKDPWGNYKAGFTVKGKINRKDWELNWNAALEAGGVLVSDEIKIDASIQLSKNPD